MKNQKINDLELMISGLLHLQIEMHSHVKSGKYDNEHMISQMERIDVLIGRLDAERTELEIKK